MTWFVNRKSDINGVFEGLPIIMRGIDEDSRYSVEFTKFTNQLRLRIIELRKRKGLTQEDMQTFELSLRQYQRIEQGETKNITLSNLFKIAKALDVKFHELFLK